MPQSTPNLASPFRFGKSILIVPDAHVRPDESKSDFDRIIATGKLIRDLKPDIVVCLGDLGDFDSLNPHKPKEGCSFDGKALSADVRAFKNALYNIRAFTDEENRKHQKNRHRERMHEPHFVILEGNHEERFRRHPETAGDLIGHDLLKRIAEDLGWSWHRFLDPVEIEGVLFSHYFTSGVSRQPAQVGTFLAKAHRSAVWSHTHSFGYDQKPVLGAGTISALCAGCLKPPSRVGPHEWSGLVMLNDVRNGSFSIQQIPYDHLLEAYGEEEYARCLRYERARATAA